MTGTPDDIASRLRRARVASFLTDGEGSAAVAEDDPLAALIERTAAVYAQAIGDGTRADYARRWRKFETWCEHHGFESLPAAPETVMLYLAAKIDSNVGMSLSTARGLTAAIGRVHREAGLSAPNDSPVLSQFMRGLSRHSEARPARPTQTDALRIGELRRVCRHLDSLMVDPRATRDAAILGLHLVGFGDGQISRLVWNDLEIDDDAITIRVLSPRGGPDRRLTIETTEDAGATLLAAVLAWRTVGTENPSPVFSHVEPSGWRRPEALTPRAIFKVRRSRLTSLGVEGQRITVPDAIVLLSGPPSEVLRDHALLLLGWAMSARRPEVTGLRWSDVVEQEGGLVVHIRSSKTDLSGRGVSVGIPKGQSTLTDPVAAFNAWKARVALQLGETGVAGERHIFTAVGRSGRITEPPLSSEALTRLVSRRAHAAGCVGHWGGRSLRSGFVSTAADLDIPLDQIASQTRHKDLNSLVAYIRRQDPLRRNAAGQVGL